MDKKRQRGGRIKRCKAQKIKVAEKILDEFRNGEYTLGSICKSYKVSPRTFRNWVSRPTEEEIKKGINRGFIAEVAALYEASKEEAWEAQDFHLLETAHAALLRALKGFEYEVVFKKVESDNDGGEEKELVYRKIKKYRPPSAKLIIWVMANLEPEKWKHEP